MTSEEKEIKAGECPSPHIWGLICLGILPEQQTEAYLEHSAGCPECSLLLRQATDVLSTDSSTEEEVEVSKAESSNPIWQEQMAQTMMAAVGTGQAKQQSGRLLRWRSTVQPVYWKLAAACILLVSGVTGWFLYNRSHSADHLLAQAYDENRILELRIPGAHCTQIHPLSTMRGSGSMADQPAPLLEARGLIARELEKNPRDPKWLELEARAHLLDGDLDRSLETTNHLLLLHPENHDLLLDAAIAYFQRGQLSENPQDIGQTIDLLGRLLSKTPNDSVALYNQAIAFEHLFLFDNAVRTWKSFLSVEKDKQWREDGQQHLQRVQDLLRSKQGAIHDAPLDNAHIFALAANKKTIPEQDEELSTVQLPNLLRAAYPDPGVSCGDVCLSARLVLTNLAESLKQQHNDPWLSDLLLSESSESWSKATHALADAIQANAQGMPADGLRAANEAISFFREARSEVGEARSRVEQLYAYQRLFDLQNCLKASQDLNKALDKYISPWMLIQSGIDTASCQDDADKFEREEALLEKSNAVANSSHYKVIGLRALGILAAQDTSLGDYEESWRRDFAGLKEYWIGDFPAIRAFQFYSDLGYAEEHRSNVFLSLYIHQELVSMVPKLNRSVIEASTRFRFVESLIRAGEELSAEKEFQQAQVVLSHLPERDQFRSDIALILISLARLKLEQHELADASALLEQADSVLGRSGDPEQRFSLIAQRGELLMQEGKWTEALQILRSATRLADDAATQLNSSDDRLSWLRRTEPLYAGLMRANFEVSHRADLSLALWERYRAELLGTEYALRCTRNLPNCTANAIRDQQNRLKNGSIIGNAVFDDGLLIWRVDQDGVWMHYVPIPRKELLRKVEAFTQFAKMSRGNDEDLKTAGRELFRILIEPAWKGQNAGQMVYLEPDAAFAGFPFAALPFLDSYWGLVAPLSNIVSVLQDDADNPSMQKAFAQALPGSPVIIGNPRLSPQIAPPLPDAAIEARYISSMVPRATLLLGEDAERNAILSALPNALIFHFAGHTQSWSSHTRLLLAGSSSESSFPYPSVLTSSDILAANPKKCKLVVLSACSTGNRESREPNVVSDMVSSFAEVGVPEIIATHWSVDSASSAILMRCFYTQLMEGMLAPMALEKAQASLIAAGYTHPRYWASFYAVGFGRINYKEMFDGYKSSHPFGSPSRSADTLSAQRSN